MLHNWKTFTLLIFCLIIVHIYSENKSPDYIYKVHWKYAQNLNKNCIYLKFLASCQGLAAQYWVTHSALIKSISNFLSICQNVTPFNLQFLLYHTCWITIFRCCICIYSTGTNSSIFCFALLLPKILVNFKNLGQIWNLLVLTFSKQLQLQFFYFHDNWFYWEENYWDLNNLC